MIKLINYGLYVNKEVFISKDVIHSMERMDDMTNIIMVGGCHYTVKETPEEILSMPDIEEGNKVIDWEQRRYEIAKEMLPVIYCDEKQQDGDFYCTLKQAAYEAVIYAESLIAELNAATNNAQRS